MQATPTITATRVGRQARRPRTHGAGRVCSDQSCTIILSRYNDAPTCRTHTAFTRPRVRGVKS